MGGEEKSEKKPAPSIHSQSAQGKRTETLGFLPCGPFTVPPESARHPALGGGVGGVYSAFSAETLPGAPPSRGQRGAGCAGPCAPAACPRQVLALPGAPAGLCAPAPLRPACDARGDSCGRGPGGGEGTQGRGRRGGGAASRARASVPASLPRRRGPKGHRRRRPAPPQGEMDPRGPCARTQIDPHSGSRQLAAIATRPPKVWRRRNRLERKFSLAPRSSPPARPDRKQQETGARDVRTPASTSPFPASAALPRWVPCAGLPAPSQAQASWDAARPTHHGDSRRGRASAGSGCRGAGAGTQSPGRTSKVGSLRQKQALDTQALTGANENPGGTPSRRDRRR